MARRHAKAHGESDPKAQRDPKTQAQLKSGLVTSTALAEHLAKATSLFKALAHPIRLQALLLLSERGPLSAGALQKECAVEQSAFSHQLRVLREHRLVFAQRVGREIHYALVDDHVQHIVRDAIAHIKEECSEEGPDQSL